MRYISLGSSNMKIKEYIFREIELRVEIWGGGDRLMRFVCFNHSIVVDQF